MAHMPSNSVGLAPITPAALPAGATVNYWPTGLQHLGIIRQATNVSGSSIASFVAQSDGFTFWVDNLGPGLLTISNENSAGTTTGRITAPTAVDVILPANAIACVRYDGTTARYRCESISWNQNWNPQLYGYNAKSYGAVGNGVTDDTAAIQAALNDAATTFSSGVYGSFVYLPKGTYQISSGLTLPSGCGLRGDGPASTIIKAANTFNAASMITNLHHDGTQEYAFIWGITVEANQGGGAVCSTAAVDMVSLFVNSFVRDCIILDSSTVGLHVGALAGAGPFLIENTWVARCLNDNVYLEEMSGNTSAVTGINCIGLTTEHPANGYSALHLKGRGSASGWNFTNTHIEMASGTYGILIDGVAHCLFDNVNLLITSASATAGISITNVAQNVGIQFRAVANHNVLSPCLQDLKNGITTSSGTLGSGNIDSYATADVGIIPPGAYKVAAYGTTIALDMTVANYFEIDVSNTTAFTIANPTNSVTGQMLWLEIANGSGGSMGTITWGTNFPFMATWTNPANGKRRVIGFIRRNTGAWIQIAAVAGDM